MKRYGHLYEKIYDKDNLRLAHQNARKGKTHYKEVVMVDDDPEFYINKIHEMLVSETYSTSEYKTFTKIDKGKEREIFVLPYYPDRIIQWAIVQILEPIWMPTFIDNTYSSLKGRGIHYGLRKLKKDLKDVENTKYCLKLDVKKFYPSITHNILKIIIRKKIKDNNLLRLLDQIIDSAEGVPIGNYLSQYFGNIYLSEFDHWVKEKKHIKYYHRYCDDIVILHASKEILYELLSEIHNYLDENLKLKLKYNYQIFPTNVRGIDFLGYRFFHSYILLRKRIAKTLKKKMLKLKKFAELTKRDLNVIVSYTGWLKWCNGYKLYNKYIKPLKEKGVVSW
jgi:hypothetical protein